MIDHVQASAGSGKTYSLTRRFLGLLLACGRPAPACGPTENSAYGPQAVLAITFTNKASAEMKSRVLEALKELALGRPDPDFAAPRSLATARAILERLLRHPHLLNIRTIDSLLYHLARLFALELGLPPDFQAGLDEDQVFEDLHDLVCSRLEDGDPALRSLVTRMTDALVLGQGISGFWIGPAVRDRLKGVFRHLLEGKGHGAADAQALVVELRGLTEALSQAANALRLALETLQAEPVSAFAAFLEALARGGPDLPESAFAHKKDLADCVKKASRERLTPDAQELFQELRARHLQAAARGPALRGALACLPFLDFGREMLRAFEPYRRDQGMALLAQLPGQVADLLAEGGGVPEAYCRLGARLTHLLIDEFQDTSRGQWQALSHLARECLAKGGSLFYVGDVKQAIYGWRGGDASLFDRAAEESGLTRLATARHEVLPFNRRSAPVVVAFNNRFFSALGDPAVAGETARAMLPQAPGLVVNEMAEAVRASFAGAAQQVPPGERPPGFVRLVRLAGDDQRAYQESVRAAFAALFPDDLLVRRPPGDLAVLTRTNAEAELAAGWLLDLGVPVVTENSLRLGEHPIVQGVLAFLAFLDYPPDNLALWRFLSCRELFGRPQGLDREKLTDWLAAQPKGLLSPRFQRDFPEIWDRFFAPFLRGARLTTPYDITWELVCACRVLETTPEAEVFIRRFLEMVHNAETQGYGSLATFLEFWKANGGQETIPQPDEARAVRVLTVHKAKGLEFPAVVVPFHQFPTAPRGGLADFELDGLPLTAPLVKDLGLPYHRRLAKTLEEQLNLLYVAWTRPEQELHIFLPASQRLSGRSPLTRAVDTLHLAVGLDPTQAETTFGPAPPRPGRLVDIPAAPPAPGPGPTPAPPAAAEPLAWLPGLKIARCEPPDPSQRLDFTQRRRGMVLHKALEGFDPHAACDPARLIRRAAACLGFSPDEQAVAGLAEALTWLTGQDFFRRSLADGLPEAELLDDAGNVHRPDLLVMGSDEILVLDYKTGGEDPEHVGQLRRYLNLAQALPQARGKPVRGLLAYADLRLVRTVDREDRP